MSNVTEVRLSRSLAEAVVVFVPHAVDARRTGGPQRVSRRLVVQIEQGEANPSIGTLLRLAGAFEVTLTDLVGDQQTTTVGVSRPVRRGRAVAWAGRRQRTARGEPRPAGAVVVDTGAR